MSMRMGKGSNKGLYKEALAQVQTLFILQERLPFHIDVASTLKKTL